MTAKEMKMLLKRLKITHKVLLVILIGVILSAIFAVSTVVVSQNDIRKMEVMYKNNMTPLDDMRNIQSIFRELEFRMAGVMADVVDSTAAEAHLKQSVKDIDANWSDIGEAISSYDLSDEARASMETYEKGYIGFKNNIVAILQKAYSDGGPDEVAEVYDEWLDYKPLVMKTIDSFAATLKNSVKEQYETGQSEASNLINLIVITALIGIGLFAAFALVIVKSIKQPIDTVVDATEHIAGGDLTKSINITSEDEMGSMARQFNIMVEHLRDAFCKITASVEKMNLDTDGLSGLAKSLLAGAEEQRSQGEQIAASSTEMSETIFSVAKDTTEATEATKESFEIAASGQETVREAVESINMLAGRVGDASNTIDGLGRNLVEIGEIVSVIQDIADQTNLLALNAAIEAARSGEHGRGFAVVADEVRKLAERTGKATDEITSKVSIIQKESRESIEIMEKGSALAGESVEKAEKAGQSLQQIVDSSSRVMDIVKRVSEATEEQSSAAEEVSQTTEHISGIISEHCGLAGEVENSAASLSSIAQNIVEQLAYFKTDSGSGTKSSANVQADKKGIPHAG